MRSILFITLFLFVSPLVMMAQFGYLFQSKDSISSAVFVDQGYKKNAVECAVIKYDSITRYSPDEIYGYSIKQGPRYYSKKVSIDGEYKKLFLELIGEADHKLFYLNLGEKRFFLEINEDSLYEIRSKKNGRILNFDDQLAKLLDNCDFITKQSEHVKFTKTSMKLFINRYKGCIRKPFPRFKFGAFAGYGLYKYKSNINNDHLELLSFDYSGSPSFGIFLDQPLYLGALTFHLEAIYFKQASVTTYESNEEDIDLVVNAHTLNVPIQLRYTFYGRKISPYISSGFVFSYNFIKNADLSWAKFYNDNTVRVFFDEEPHLSKRQLGYIFGIGLEYQILEKYAIFTEIKYESLYGKPNYSLQTKFINFNIGIII